MNDTPLIDARQISRTYLTGEVSTTALHPVTLTINHGEFVAIMGPSGSGKSTLLHILGLLDRPSTGHYLFSGQDISRLRDQDLAYYRNQKIGFIFQTFHLLARASVINNVMLPLQYSRQAVKNHRRLATEAIQKVGLAHREHYQPSQLSGGEKQRVVIARALVQKPQLLLADEPTGNLDSKTGQAVMDLIDGLHNEGLTVIVITHETPTANFAQRIIRLADGQIESDRPNTTIHGHYAK